MCYIFFTYNLNSKVVIATQNLDISSVCQKRKEVYGGLRYKHRNKSLEHQTPNHNLNQQLATMKTT